MKTILSFIGTRPEAIKMMPVLRALAVHDDLRSIVVSTGQHREMLRQTFALLDISPQIDLDVMQANQSLAVLTANLLRTMDDVLEQHSPDWVLAQGDTTTVMVAALLCHYRHLPFGHIEAGLRTGDLNAPFPEEANRRIADLLATAYFAPTEQAAAILCAEGVSPSAIHITGNTAVDAAQAVSVMPFAWQDSPLAVVAPDAPFVLITAHRRENFGAPLERICAAIAQLAQLFPQFAFIYTVHLNPNVQATVHHRLGNITNVHLMPPLDYPAMIQAIRHARCILTDSGGIQEEAPSFGVPLLVLRESTERPEGVAAGCATLVGTDIERIVAAVANILSDPTVQHHSIVNPYGDGQAAARIVRVLREGK